MLESQAAYTYAAALTLLQDPAYAAATATILPIEAQHAVVLGLALGKSVEDVFPTGAFESAALGDGTDPLAGLDPAVFPVDQDLDEGTMTMSNDNFSNDEVRRQLRFVDRANDAVMPAGDADRLFSGDENLTTDPKAAILGVPIPSPGPLPHRRGRGPRRRGPCGLRQRRQ